MSSIFSLDYLDKSKNLYKPNYYLNITKLMPTLVESLGVKNIFDKLPKELIKLDSDYDININLMIDALGLQQLLNLQQSSDILSNYSNLLEDLGAFPLSSVFPTITSTAITSYHTALKPIEHGILGHRIYFPEIGNIVDTLQIATVNNRTYTKDSLFRTGIDPKVWLFDTNSINYITDTQDIHRIEISHYGIHNSGLSHFYRTYSDNEHHYGRNSLVNAFSVAEMVIKKLVKEKKKGIINIYFGEIDSASHLHGPLSINFLMELKLILDSFKWFINQISKFVDSNRKIIISVTADHGQATVNPEKQTVLVKRKMKFLNKVHSTGRVIHCHSLDKENLFEELSELFGEKAAIIGLDETVKLLGGNSRTTNSIKEKVKQRIGDYQVILKDEENVEIMYPDEQNDFHNSSSISESFIEWTKLGSHGSLTLNELVVPVIIANYNDFKNALN